MAACLAYGGGGGGRAVRLAGSFLCARVLLRSTWQLRSWKPPPPHAPELQRQFPPASSRRSHAVTMATATDQHQAAGSSSLHNRPRVIVVGAGFAGLAAAGELSSANDLVDVLVLEASERAGGRVNTARLGPNNTVCERGATWIHGKVGNPVFDLAVKHKLLPEDPPDAFHHDIRQWHSHGTKGPLAGDSVRVVESTAERINTLIEESKAVYNASKQKSGQDITDETQSVMDYIRERWRPAYTGQEADLEKAVFDWRVNLECNITGADSLSELSLKWYGTYEELDDYNLTIPAGFSAITEALKTCVPAESIRFNAQVASIDWLSDENYVNVQLTSGETLRADFVIMTVSLGVLKSGAIEFKPPLSKAKQCAIQRLGFGVVDKVFVLYERPVLSEDEAEGHFVTVLWPRAGGDDVHNDGVDVPEWVKRMPGFEAKSDRLLGGWISGNAARELEEMSDAQVLAGMQTVMTECFSGLANGNDGDTTDGSRVMRTTWGKDPLFRGSYSFIPVGATPQDQVELAAPLTADDTHKTPRVCFAGEATHPRFYSTTHGALLSGRREAQRILEFVRQQRLSPTRT
eukprot:jgi/Chlat1/4751/Chrsp308S04723